MKHLIKITLLSTLFLFFTASTMKAAFPTDKTSVPAVVLNAENGINNSLVEKQATSKELKKQIKALKHENSKPMGGGKSKIVAALLAFFLGGLGIHSFYMGQTKKGFFQLGITVLGIVLFAAGIGSWVSGAGVAFPTTALIGYLLILGVAIWAFVDFIRILTGGLAPEEGFND
jgi:TM2 domain-containing membrane protein YozV